MFQFTKSQPSSDNGQSSISTHFAQFSELLPPSVITPATVGVVTGPLNLNRERRVGRTLDLLPRKSERNFRRATGVHCESTNGRFADAEDAVRPRQSDDAIAVPLIVQRHVQFSDDGEVRRFRQKAVDLKVGIARDQAVL